MNITPTTSHTYNKNAFTGNKTIKIIADKTIEVLEKYPRRFYKEAGIRNTQKSGNWTYDLFYDNAKITDYFDKKDTLRRKVFWTDNNKIKTYMVYDKEGNKIRQVSLNGDSYYMTKFKTKK